MFFTSSSIIFGNRAIWSEVKGEGGFDYFSKFSELLYFESVFNGFGKRVGILVGVLLYSFKLRTLIWSSIDSPFTCETKTLFYSSWIDMASAIWVFRQFSFLIVSSMILLIEMLYKVKSWLRSCLLVCSPLDLSNISLDFPVA